MFEYRSGGRHVSQSEFFENLKRRAIDAGFAEIEKRARGAASSIVDPATGKHAEVFVYRRGDESVLIRTKGSPEFARELERRLGVKEGSIKSMSDAENAEVPRVYLAHASEDHETLAKPLAERLLAQGIDVWLDGWEIRAGDSLRRKMEEGLGSCTHFMVLLTPKSLGKPWVETEVDVGFVKSVEGKSRFIGVRCGVTVSALSPFLQTLRCPEVDLASDAAVDALIADIYGASRKPPRGEAPRYVKTVPEGLRGWSPSAVAVAEYLVRNSENGCEMEPQSDIEEASAATGLPEEDVRLGVLDLERHAGIGTDMFWPKVGLFVEFDRHFLGFDNQADAVAVANLVTSESADGVDVSELAKRFPDWSVRRLNSALNYLDAAKLVQPLKSIGQGPWSMVCFNVTDRTRRFVRDHG
jgi:hypothetical protein